MTVSLATWLVIAPPVLFAREPLPDEVDLAVHFLAKPTTSSMSRWEQYAQVLLPSDEMLYVD